MSGDFDVQLTDQFVLSIFGFGPIHKTSPQIVEHRITDRPSITETVFSFGIPDRVRVPEPVRFTTEGNSKSIAASSPSGLAVFGVAPSAASTFAWTGLDVSDVPFIFPSEWLRVNHPPR